MVSASGWRGPRLQLEIDHWPEVMDAKHRYNPNLRHYFELWAADANAHEPFFQWLDGDSSLSTSACPRAMLEAQRVKFCTPEEADLLRVEVCGGRLRYASTRTWLETRGPPRVQEGGKGSAAMDCAAGTPVCALHLDVRALRAYRTHDMSAGGSAESGGGGGGDDGGCLWGSGDAAACPRAHYMFVLDTRGRLYVAQKVKGLFHHTSFLRGAPLAGAGGIRVHDGVPERVTATSGHYKPTQSDMDLLVGALAGLGVDLTTTTIGGAGYTGARAPYVYGELGRGGIAASAT